MKSLAYVAATAACLAAPAWADSFASVTMYNMGYRLVDLDLGDGISPSVVFADDSHHNGRVGYFVSESHRHSPIEFEEDHALAETPFGPASVAVTRPLSEAHASISGNGTLQGTTLRAEGRSISNEDTEGVFNVGANVLYDNNSAYTTDALTLSPHTRIELFAQVTVSTSLTYDGYVPQPGQDNAVGLGVIRLYDGTSYVYEEIRSSGLISATFDNVSTEWLGLGAAMEVEAVGRSYYPIPIVPEPASGALLGIGAWVVMGTVRRRQR